MISIYASNHFTRQEAAFHAFVEWVTSRTAPAEQRRALAVLARNVYWAYVANREIRNQLVEPLRALRVRAVAMEGRLGC